MTDPVWFASLDTVIAWFSSCIAGGLLLGGCVAIFNSWRA